VATVESGRGFWPNSAEQVSGVIPPLLANGWAVSKYSTKQVEAYAVEQEGGWLVITVLVKFF
jgi:hypothetical protein